MDLRVPPTIGRIVHYTLKPQDVAAIEDQRQSLPHVRRGNDVKEGDTFPAMIVRTWGETPESAVQLQVFLDGPDIFWATSVSANFSADKIAGMYQWPPRG